MQTLPDTDAAGVFGVATGSHGAASIRERDVIRRLLEEKRAAAADPVNARRREEWRRLNDLRKVRPLVWINEIPWHEINVNDELTAQCVDPWLQSWEMELRCELYLWRHMPGDMIIDPVVFVPKVCSPTSTYADFGITGETISRAGSHDVQFVPIMKTDADIERLRVPDVVFDRAETERRVARAGEIAEGILPVVEQGILTEWFTPWDTMVRWYGIEPLFIDIYDRPDYLHRLLERFTSAMCTVLDRQEAMGLLDVSDGNYRVGSGGLGHNSTLPGPERSPSPVTAAHQWGCGNAQIFSEVSPAMHWEFSLQYEVRWIRRFGLAYYGCCEPLHNKIGLLRREVPNLRKVSISPRADVAKAAAAAGNALVLSLKPNPAVFANDDFDAAAARSDLVAMLDACRGAPAEIIMKDVSTVRNDPHRLWEWARIAVDVAARYV